MGYLTDLYHPYNLYDARFQVVTAVSMKMTDFWDAAPCSHVEVDRRFRVAYCLHYQGEPPFNHWLASSLFPRLIVIVDEK
jgi:hypothetical protein